MDSVCEKLDTLHFGGIYHFGKGTLHTGLETVSFSFYYLLLSGKSYLIRVSWFSF